MEHTVVGFFDNTEEAQNAVQELVASGIERSQIDVSAGSASNNNAADMYKEEDSTERKSGIAKFFSSLFGDDSDDARKYSTVGQSANTIVTVHAQTEDEADDAADILDDFGAFDVDDRATQYGYGSQSQTGSNIEATDDQTIERIEEELQVGKRSVDTGGVRVRSRIVARPVEENIRLREEHVRVERQSVDRPVSGDRMGSFEEKEIEMTERAEVPVVSKEARVVEEIRISKEEDERNETIRDSVRHTEVDIDDMDNTNSKNSTDTGINLGLDSDGNSDRYNINR